MLHFSFVSFIWAVLEICDVWDEDQDGLLSDVFPSLPLWLQAVPAPHDPNEQEETVVKGR